MSVQHHPSDEILSVYAVGTLEPGFGLVVGVHLAACATCRARVRVFEVASGDALRGLPQADISADALAKTLARLDERPALRTTADKRPLLERLPLGQRRWVVPGVWVAAVDTPHAPENRVYVLSVAKGGLTARHSHSGAEFCTVLKGAYQDDLGVFSAGDFAAADAALNHQPVVVGDEACVCLFATEGRLKPNGMLGQLAFAMADV